MKVTEAEASKAGRPRANRWITASEMAVGLSRLAQAAGADDPNGMDGLAAGKHLADALTSNGDAGTADVVLQMAVFGEIVYG